MAGGLFVFVRTAPPGGCALAITAGQYRPPMAHGPLSKRSGGPFFFLSRSALLQDGTPSSPRSRGHGVLVHAACRSRPLPKHGERGFFCFVRTARVMSRCHAGLRSGRESAYMVHLAGSSDRLSMLFVFLCPHAGRAGNCAVMRTCNIWTLNIPIYHIDKLSKELSVL